MAAIAGAACAAPATWIAPKKVKKAAMAAGIPSEDSPLASYNLNLGRVFRISSRYKSLNFLRKSGLLRMISAAAVTTGSSSLGILVLGRRFMALTQLIFSGETIL